MAKSKKLSLKAEKRKLLGRKVKKLRREGILPANIYGKKIASEAIQVLEKDFTPLYQEAGETSIVELNLDKSPKPVLISNVQLHPVTSEPLHIDFLQVDLKEKVKANVPIELVGEAPAEKEGKGTLVQQLNEVEVEALPADLPSEFKVDVSGLAEVDVAIYIKDLKVAKGVELVGVEPEQVVVGVVALQKEEEPEPVAETAEGEAVSEEATPESQETPTEVPAEEKASE